jgi:hypothetical protein
MIAVVVVVVAVVVLRNKWQLWCCDSYCVKIDPRDIIKTDAIPSAAPQQKLSQLLVVIWPSSVVVRLKRKNE